MEKTESKKSQKEKKGKVERRDTLVLFHHCGIRDSGGEKHTPEEDTRKTPRHEIVSNNVKKHIKKRTVKAHGNNKELKMLNRNLEFRRQGKGTDISVIRAF